MTPTRLPHARNLFIVANNIEEIGGLQRVVHTLSAGFAARGHRVELIGIAPGPGPERIRPEPGYSTLTLGRAEPREWQPRGLRNRLRLDKQARELYRRRLRARHVALLQQRLDAVDQGIVIVGQVWAMQWVADADTSRHRVIAMSHESYEASRGLVPTALGSTRYTRIMELYPPVDSFLLLTEADARKFEQDGLCNVGVMPNPLPMWPESTSSLSERVVVALGRLEVEKRYDRLVDAWVQVHERHPDWQLHIYGGGSLHAVLQQQIDASGLAASVTLKGSTDDVAGVLGGASVLALSSEQEGLPLVLAEAMACGVPCVAFDCAPGIRAIIRDGEDGIVVRNRDVTALAEGISTLLSDEELRRELGRRARENIARFRLDVVLDSWQELFEKVER